MISNSGSDERKMYSGGSAGDQTGREWAVIPWYSRPWTVMYRYPMITIGEAIADLARKAANNDLCGYDQSERTSYWFALRAAGYDPAKIKTKCEADCSAGVAANVKAVGYLYGIDKLRRVSYSCYTGNLGAALKEAGFIEYKDPKYLSSDKYLMPGDILLYPYHHTAVNLDYGSEAVRPANPDRWIHDDDGVWHYQLSTGEYVRNDWRQINHHWYYFDEEGRMLTGGQKIGGTWYFLYPEGDLEGACCKGPADWGQEPTYV